MMKSPKCINTNSVPTDAPVCDYGAGHNICENIHFIGRARLYPAATTLDQLGEPWKTRWRREW